jgi:hypothetical protein
MAWHGRNAMELISVHIPKTAGTALRNVLRQVYRSERLYEDYTDRPLDPQSPFNSDPATWHRERDTLVRHLGPHYRAIHGHFAAIKYQRDFPEARRIVWLREPASWLISLYFFWKNLPRRDNTLHHRLLDEGLSFVEFVELPEAQNRFTRIFLKGAALEEFAFVGLQEHFDEDFQQLARLMAWPDIKPELVNINPEARYRAEIQRFRSDSALMARLAHLNAEDGELYRQAQRLRVQRMADRRRQTWYKEKCQLSAWGRGAVSS